MITPHFCADGLLRLGIVTLNAQVYILIVIEAISKLNTIGLTQLDQQEYSEAVEDKPQRQVE